MCARERSHRKRRGADAPPPASKPADTKPVSPGFTGTLPYPAFRIGPWTRDAACRAHPDPDLFFDEDREAEAAAFCGGCPVRADCLGHATDGDECGVWAGTTRAERAAHTTAA
ncbi:WhiB family transcriptional regulator [Streptomyces sp. NPDC057554]|uniref:WhiB family transcriptional regulator n=1 Tax=Streptomyces sp. NPDC057554 TaxID=3350538 RepID=UPI0036BBAD9E